jgi:hypothetical protein
MSMNIPVGWELPEELSRRVGAKLGRQRALIANGQILLVLHKVPTSKSSEREGAAFWRDGEGNWRSTNGREGIGALTSHVGAYLEAVSQLEVDYDKAQNSHDYFRILEQVVPIHRAANNQLAAIQTARVDFEEARELISIRDMAAEADRIAEILQIDAKNALDYQIAKQNEEQARLANEVATSTNRLNFIAAMFLPLTAISSVFGMTIRSGLEGSSPLLFWLIFITGTLMGLFLGIMVSRRSK